MVKYFTSNRFFFAKKENVSRWNAYSYEIGEKKVTTNLFIQLGKDVRLQNFIVDDGYGRQKVVLTHATQCRDKRPVLVLSERSLVSNIPVFIEKLLDDKKIEPVDFALLREKSLQLHHFLLSDFKLKPIFILLNDNAANLMSRLRERNRIGEEDLTEDYLNDLTQRYLRFYATLAAPSKIFDLTSYQKENNPLDLDLDALVEDIWNFVKI